MVSIFFDRQVVGTILKTFLLSELFCGTLPSWLKVISGAVGLVCWVDGLVDVVGRMVGP